MKLNPIELKNGKLVDPDTLEPVKGGLFDPALVGVGDKWAKISLASPIPNPAFEKQIQQLLGITNAQLRTVLTGELTQDEAQGK